MRLGCEIKKKTSKKLHGYTARSEYVRAVPCLQEEVNDPVTFCPGSRSFRERARNYFHMVYLSYVESSVRILHYRTLYYSRSKIPQKLRGCSQRQTRERRLSSIEIFDTINFICVFLSNITFDQNNDKNIPNAWTARPR